MAEGEQVIWVAIATAAKLEGITEAEALERITPDYPCPCGHVRVFWRSVLIQPDGSTNSFRAVLLRDLSPEAQAEWKKLVHF